MQGPPALPELAAALARHGLKRDDLGATVGVSGSTISAIVRGTIRPSTDLRQRIADYFDADVDELFKLDPGIERLIEQAVAQGFARTVQDTTVLRRVVALAGPGSDRWRAPAEPRCGDDVAAGS